MDSESSVGPVTGYRHVDDKPLPQTMMTEFADSYMRHQCPVGSTLVQVMIFA